MSPSIGGPAPKPCATCPYRRDVPAGVWAASEYRKLQAYDRDTSSQPMELFACHQTGVNDPGKRLCAGWVACHGGELLALRLGVLRGSVDPSVFDYATPVPLFESGAAAAAHGLSGVEHPNSRAVRAVRKIAKRRGLAL